jgi:hypothetical protein
MLQVVVYLVECFRLYWPFLLLTLYCLLWWTMWLWMHTSKDSVNLEPNIHCSGWNLFLSDIGGLMWEPRVSVKYWIAYHLIDLVLKVWKQKGEEYRVHGQWGWLWLSTSRKFKIQDCHKMGLRAGPQKIMVQVKGNECDIVLTLLMAITEYSAVECFLCMKVFMFWCPERTRLLIYPLLSPLHCWTLFMCTPVFVPWITIIF